MSKVTDVRSAKPIEQHFPLSYLDSARLTRVPEKLGPSTQVTGKPARLTRHVRYIRRVCRTALSFCVPRSNFESLDREARGVHCKEEDEEQTQPMGAIDFAHIRDLL